MYYIILLAVISSLATMILAFQYEKQKDETEKPKIKIQMWQIYISSLLMGSFGAIFAMIGFNFQVKNKKFMFFQILLLIVQVTAIVLIGKK